MGLNKRRNLNPLHVSIPLLDSAGNVEGWYRFDDAFLSPEVRYRAFPPTTWLKIGSRSLEIDRAVPLKLRLLEEEEDFHFWCNKKQHGQRINCGEYHRDFGDVEIGYSFSSPQTHIWFAGYAIHADCFENIFVNSYNASVRVTPEHILPQGQNALLFNKDCTGAGPMGGGAMGKVPITDLVPTKSLFQMVLEEGADLPIYAAAIPVRIETHKGYTTQLVPCAEFINDCERDIIKREAYDVGAAIAQKSDPVSYPPTYPHVKPFEHPGLFWSFVHNQLLVKRLARDELEQAVKDIALLNRMSQYDLETLRRDQNYKLALERLANHFASKEAIHKATWPLTRKTFDKCQCVLCEKARLAHEEHLQTHHVRAHTAHTRRHTRHGRQPASTKRTDAEYYAEDEPRQQPPRERYDRDGISQRLTNACKQHMMQAGHMPRAMSQADQQTRLLSAGDRQSLHGLLATTPGTTPLLMQGGAPHAAERHTRFIERVPSVLDTTARAPPPSVHTSVSILR